MARTPDNGISARSEKITVRGTVSWVRLVDRLRGDLSRSAYFRQLVQRDFHERNESPRSAEEAR